MKGLQRKILALLLCVLMAAGTVTAVSAQSYPANTAGDTGAEVLSSSEEVFLSDIADTTLIKSSVGYDVLKFDQNIENGTISLKVDGQRLYFDKGLGAHADSILVFDLQDYIENQGYTRFLAYLGLDYSKGDYGDGVTFKVSLSKDNSQWQTVKETGILKGTSEAVYVDIDLTGNRYLKIEAFKNENDGSDHSVIADAKLVKSDYAPEISSDVKTLDEYDSLLKAFAQEHSGMSYAQLMENYPEYEMLLLQRAFVSMAGYSTLKYYGKTQENLQLISRIMNDKEFLELYINGGEPNGTYTKTLDVLKSLLNAHEADLSDTENGPLYKRMMVTLSLTHSINVPFWEDDTQVSDPVTRYEIYKKLYVNDLLINDVFGDLNVEEMRWVMNNLISDDQIEWLNYYVRFHTDRANIEELNINNFTPGPYAFITYTFDYDYTKPEYYTEENKESWQKKWKLTNEYKLSDEETNGKASVYDINVEYAQGKPKLWIVFEEGSVCGGIAKTGTNLLASFGVPGVILTQPGHAAYLQLGINENGQYTWSIGNDVSGWSQSQREEHYGREDTRMLIGWGNEEWASEYYASYVLLAQAVLNNEDTFYKSNKLNKLAQVYSDDPETQIEVYEEALTIENKNLDSWEGLIKAYAAAGKSDEEFLSLAQRISENLKYYPLPMSDILKNLLSSYVKSEVTRSQVENYIQASLNAAAKATEADVLQPVDTITMANYLLGNTQPMASFSFDGDKAGKIVLSDMYSGENQLLYCINGDTENGWINAGTVTEVTLTTEELAQVNAENKILVRLQGSTNYYTINIVQGEMPETAYLNDNENKIFGVNEPMEYHTGDGVWKDITSDTRFEGDITVTVRIKAHDTTTTSAEKTFKFTDNTSETKKYITIDRITVDDVSSEETSWGQLAVNAIDGDINTLWHTLWDGSDTERYITVKFDQPVKLSAFEYTSRQEQYSANGRVLAYEIYTSMDGKDWKLSASGDDWLDNPQKKTVEFETPVETQYVKFVAINGVGGFMSATMLEFYEDASTEETFKVGDVNHDGILTIEDVTLIQQYLTQMDMTGKTFDVNLAETNGDDIISISDATYLQIMISINK